MRKRLIPAVLIALLVALHAQLWFGRGSVPNVARLQSRIDEQQRKNDQATLANMRLEAEIRDLREGLEIVEEKARSELGMVKSNEIYVQFSR
jgi:cell division protein FtsB